MGFEISETLLMAAITVIVYGMWLSLTVHSLGLIAFIIPVVLAKIIWSVVPDGN
ncbi:MAG: hypothetical protein AB7U75_14820 [Hyphomicrobiaceae bacterium]